MTASPRPPITRQAIVDVALATAARGELETLTMRGLADELGVTAMALYTHVDGKDDILDAVLDRLLTTEVPLPPVGPEGAELDWRSWMLTAARGLQALLVGSPALLDRFRSRPVGVPQALRRMEASLEVLRRAGFGDDESVGVYAIVHTYTIGFAALESGRRSAARAPAPERPAPGVLTEASPHYWPAFLAGLDAGEFPNLTRLTPDLAEFTTDEQFDRGLDALLAGIEAQRSP